MYQLMLETERTYLITPVFKMTKEILDFYVRNKAHLEQWENLRDDNFYTFKYQKKMIKYLNKERKIGTGLFFWIYSNTSNKIIGNIYVSSIILGNVSSCNIGYALDQYAQGYGYMTESLSEIVRMLFKDCNLHRIEINIMPRNHKSIQLVNKLGFKYDTTSEELMRVNGVWEDHDRYYIINPN